MSVSENISVTRFDTLEVQKAYETWKKYDAAVFQNMIVCLVYGQTGICMSIHAQIHTITTVSQMLS